MTQAVDVYVNGQFVRRFSLEDHGSDYAKVASDFASAKDRNGEVRPVSDEPITDPARLLPAGEVAAEEAGEEVAPEEEVPFSEAPADESTEATPESAPSTDEQVSE